MAQALTGAIALLSGMQIGSSTIRVRLAKAEDRELYTGCLYSLSTAVSAVCPPESMRPAMESEWMGTSHDAYHGWEEPEYESWKQPQMS
ncbi:AKR1 [Symbiodinium natans]|uniref:AKR1 protein n=1 Tax=Symbiodinium natans TaxID=878477 RepID=A0A812PBY3_9DINO|nr:AKR1 [Symbiodinium natans]